MTRPLVLRLGYGALGAAFLALTASVVAPFLLPASLVLAFAGGLLLAWSDDDLPKWAGIALVAYFVISLVAFLAATPATIRLRGFSGFFNSEPSALARAVFDYLVLAMPLVLAGTATASVWEREWPPRLLLAGAVAGFILVGLLSVVLNPRDVSSIDVAQATAQANMLRGLFSISAAAGAIGAFWATARPEEVAL